MPSIQQVINCQSLYFSRSIMEKLLSVTENHSLMWMITMLCWNLPGGFRKEKKRKQNKTKQNLRLWKKVLLGGRTLILYLSHLRVSFEVLLVVSKLGGWYITFILMIPPSCCTSQLKKPKGKDLLSHLDSHCKRTKRTRHLMILQIYSRLGHF